MSIELIIITVIGPIISWILLFLNNKHSPEDLKSIILKSWFWGIIAFVGALLLIIFFDLFDLATTKSLKRTLFYAFIVIGFSQEFMKYVFLNIFITSKKVCNSPTRIILSSIALSLGFVSMENIYFIITNGGGHFSFTEGYLSVPAHIILGILMGFFISFGKFRSSRYLFPSIGLGTAIFFHGLFQFSLFSKDNTLLAIIIAVSLIVAILLFKKANKTTREDIDHINRKELEEELRG